uniref:Uncharacterized protein n=3 Tax=Oryza TaxID=4527 RepID=A0A0D3HVA9_9ORYZ
MVLVVLNHSHRQDVNLQGEPKPVGMAGWALPTPPTFLTHPQEQMAMRMPLQTAVVTDICRQGGLENLQHFVGSTLICFIGVVLLVGFVHA